MTRPAMTRPANDPRYLAAVRLGVVALVFSAVVAALLAYDYVHRGQKHPAEEQAYVALLTAARQQPDNQKLEADIRVFDAQLRQEYFRHRAFTVVGAILLGVGMIVAHFAWKVAASLDRPIPTPGPAAPPLDREAQRAAASYRGLLTLCGVVVVCAAIVVGAIRTPLPLDGQTAEDATSPTPLLPVDPEVERAWPRFRGPDGSGVARFDNIPTEWNVDTGENILWKTKVPLHGNNSPVVWGNRVFVSGADETHREVYCFDATTGAILWQQPAPSTPESTATVPKVLEDTGYAAPTTATDGQRVYAIFANGDLAAFTVEGKLAWSKSLGIPKNAYGHASSLMVHRGRLVVQFDQGGKEEKLSCLFAFDAATGRIAWQVAREVPNSWATPIVIRVGSRDLVVTAADPWAMAYDIEDGREIWRAKVLRQDVGPSPTSCGNVVYTVSEFPALFALQADGEGDLTKDKATHERYVRWRSDEALPDTASPLATDDSVFVLVKGSLVAYDAKTGLVRWEKDFDELFSASPTLVGNRLLLVDVEGTCWFVEPSDDDAKIVAHASLGEGCVTSPALQDGRMYLRGREHLFCIGRKGTP